MARHKLLLSGALLLLAVQFASGTPAAQSAELVCGLGEIQAGLCPGANPPTSSGDIDDDHVDVSAGVDGSAGGGGVTVGVDGSTDIPPGTPEPVEPPCDPTGGLVVCRDGFIVNLAGTDLPWQVITLADIAGFIPEAAAESAEPNGWAIVGLPTNFVAEAAQHVVPGALLGLPAEVRFTPVAYSWDYGDGASESSTAGGSSWATLGLDWFDPTATSHVYAERGTVRAQLTISYTAEYRFAGPTWTPVVGILDITADPLPILVATESTVLVGNSCGPDSRLGC